jgi:hypothetical protein
MMIEPPQSLLIANKAPSLQPGNDAAAVARHYPVKKEIYSPVGITLNATLLGPGQ